MSIITKAIAALTLVIGITAVVFIINNRPEENTPDQAQTSPQHEGGILDVVKDTVLPPQQALHLMAIESLRQQQYPGGDFVIEDKLPNGTNYQQFVASYQSEGLKIYGLLTIPLAPKPEGGYPAVVFVHGHIPPRQYSTINSYPTYQAALARGGFVTFKPDLRGHGNSEGEPSSAHYSEKYTIDTLNALAYLKMHEDVNPDRIGYWGHSNGGEIGLRVAIVNPDIKASSFWAGVVGSYEDMFETYIDDIPFLSNDNNPLVQAHGLPSNNRDFWDKIDPYTYLSDITIPIQLQHGTNDSSVPVELSRSLEEALESAGKDVEYFEYMGDDHNISRNSGVAWQRTIDFFKEHL
ncbi:MAG: alpha/beta fold hydrolase [Candidatus Andersenbacteria bacterium]